MKHASEFSGIPFRSESIANIAHRTADAIMAKRGAAARRLAAVGGRGDEHHLAALRHAARGHEEPLEPSTPRRAARSGSRTSSRWRVSLSLMRARARNRATGIV